MEYLNNDKCCIFAIKKAKLIDHQDSYLIGCPILITRYNNCIYKFNWMEKLTALVQSLNYLGESF